MRVLLVGGSSYRVPDYHLEAAARFGRLVARKGWTLRTGGGSGRCVMGAAADAAFAEGGRVEGVILRKFWGVRHRRIRPLKSVPTFARRKELLLRGADAVVAFPGAYGTLDEWGDCLCLKQTGFIDSPLVLANIRGYFDDLLRWERRVKRDRFYEGGKLYSVASTPSSVVRIIYSEVSFRG